MTFSIAWKLLHNEIFNSREFWRKPTDEQGNRFLIRLCTPNVGLLFVGSIVQILPPYTTIKRRSSFTYLFKKISDPVVWFLLIFIKSSIRKRQEQLIDTTLKWSATFVYKNKKGRLLSVFWKKYAIFFRNGLEHNVPFATKIGKQDIGNILFPVAQWEFDTNVTKTNGTGEWFLRCGCCRLQMRSWIESTFFTFATIRS